MHTHTHSCTTATRAWRGRSTDQSVLTVQRKNWEPLVLGPALAMERMPGPSCLSLLPTRAACTRQRFPTITTHAPVASMRGTGTGTGTHKFSSSNLAP